MEIGIFILVVILLGNETYLFPCSSIIVPPVITTGIDDLHFHFTYRFLTDTVWSHAVIYLKDHGNCCIAVHILKVGIFVIQDRNLVTDHAIFLIFRFQLSGSDCFLQKYILGDLTALRLFQGEVPVFCFNHWELIILHSNG